MRKLAQITAFLLPTASLNFCKNAIKKTYLPSIHFSYGYFICGYSKSHLRHKRHY